tara:strand:+ start:105727 stop:106296 length:570 start_codon:yes stop_codon:yes gene_type:complete
VKEPSKQQIKERAKYLRQILLEKHKIELPHGHSLEVLAKVFGFKDWNTASALGQSAAEDISEVNGTSTRELTERPIATKFQDVGELLDFLATFDRKTKLVVNEYTWANPKTDSPLSGNLVSECSLTFDQEIQMEGRLILELNTDAEKNEITIGGSKSASQTFDRTEAGRSQRRIKYLFMKSGFWNPFNG